MTPPEAPHTRAGNLPPAASACPEILTKRSEFLACARGRKVAMSGLLLQGRDRGDGQPTIRVGFTASKKVGNAVTRNRAKRRLRAIARAALMQAGRAGWDYVLVARAGTTTTLPHDMLQADLLHALDRLHAPRASGNARAS